MVEKRKLIEGDISAYLITTEFNIINSVKSKNPQKKTNNIILNQLSRLTSFLDIFNIFM